MKSQTTNRLISIIESDDWMMDILRVHRSLNLLDSWIGAGFVRNKVWDVLHLKPVRTPLNDLDVIYFDKKHPKSEEKKIEKQLRNIDSTINWSVKNQALMHDFHNHLPYKNSEEAISHWVDTSTAIAVQLNLDNQLEVLAPYGLEDLFDLILRPVNLTKITVMQERIASKKWLEIWEELSLYIKT